MLFKTKNNNVYEIGDDFFNTFVGDNFSIDISKKFFSEPKYFKNLIYDTQKDFFDYLDKDFYYIKKTEKMFDTADFKIKSFVHNNIEFPFEISKEKDRHTITIDLSNCKNEIKKDNIEISFDELENKISVKILNNFVSNKTKDEKKKKDEKETKREIIISTLEDGKKENKKEMILFTEKDVVDKEIFVLNTKSKEDVIENINSTLKNRVLKISFSVKKENKKHIKKIDIL